MVCVDLSYIFNVERLVDWQNNGMINLFPSENRLNLLPHFDPQIWRPSIQFKRSIMNFRVLIFKFSHFFQPGFAQYEHQLFEIFYPQYTVNFYLHIYFSSICTYIYFGFGHYIGHVLITSKIFNMNIYRPRT